MCASLSSVASLANLGRILEQYRPRLLEMLERRIDPSLATRIDPGDVLAEAFLAARNRWPGVEAEMCSPTAVAKACNRQYAWLYRLVRDTLIECYRRHTAQKRDLRLDLRWPDASSIQLGYGLIDHGTSPSEALMREELQQQVRRVVSLLRERDREILWMRHNDELSFGEVALILEIHENTAIVRHLRALRRFHELWQTLHSENSLL